jgi:transposase
MNMNLFQLMIVPENHLLRLIDKQIDLSLILEKTQPYYSEDNGRPTDPLILFKMMFIGYIYGIRSERKLEQDIKMNVAYRWFLGFLFVGIIINTEGLG